MHYTCNAYHIEFLSLAFVTSPTRLGHVCPFLTHLSLHIPNGALLTTTINKCWEDECLEVSCVNNWVECLGPSSSYYFQMVFPFAFGRYMCSFVICKLLTEKKILLHLKSYSSWHFLLHIVKWSTSICEIGELVECPGASWRKQWTEQAISCLPTSMYFFFFFFLRWVEYWKKKTKKQKTL